MYINYVETGFYEQMAHSFLTETKNALTISDPVKPLFGTLVPINPSKGSFCVVTPQKVMLFSLYASKNFK